MFYESSYTQPPIITNRFFSYYLLNTKSTFPIIRAKHNLIFLSTTYSLVDFFSIGMTRAAANSSTHLTKTAVALECLSSCCFIESSLYEVYYPCIILLVSPSSPASSLLQVATAGPELKFSFAIDPVTSPLNCTASISFAIYEEYCSSFQLLCLQHYIWSLFSSFFFLPLCYFGIRK